ncbi:hypothetical protein BGZ54_001578 [Gamsiella multidivaricata]|nr:hypothetical protein BGZ54_001578 [Gamsiella multidivaricata]
MPTSKHPWYRLFCKKTLIPPIVTNEKLFSQLVSSLLAGPTPKLKTLSVRIHNHDPNLVLNLSAKTISNLQINTKSYPGKKPRMYMEDILQAYPNLIHLVLEGLFSLSSHRLENEHSHGGSSSSPSVPPAISSSNAALSVLHVLGAGSSSQMSQASYRTTSNDNAQGNGIKDEGTVLSYSIRTLKLRLVDISQEGLIALSPLLPNLTSLLIEEFLAPNMMVKIYRWTWTTEFIHSLKDAFPHLRSLRFAFPFDNIKEDTIIEILRSFPLLTEVGFRNSHFGRRALETLQEHCRHVVSLDISFACPERGFKGALIRFLQTWPQLREFIADGMIFHLDEPEDDGVLRVPWACTNLEKLVCGFHGTEPMIFEYLSAFPKMSNLTISYPPLSISPVESTLAWITKSSKMEYFWFVQHRHPPLGKSSVRWILKHWPNLKKLHVAGGTTEQKETVKQWCRDAHRLSLAVEYDLF